MSETVEKWALVAMVISGCVLLVASMLDRDWLRGLVWASVLTWAAVLLRRQ